MTKLLIKLFVKDYQNTMNSKVRIRYGTLSGAVGIALNIILSVFKIVFGSITGSIAITADGYNNFFDAGSSIISLAGFKISGKPSDKDHPFGHGRMEYVCALVLAFLIMVMGVELIKSSYSGFKVPNDVVFSKYAVIVLVASILGKIWLAYFNTQVGKAINSLAVDAVIKDSIGDIAATTATLISLILSKYTTLPIDAVTGMLVALLILWSGINIIRETMTPILGEPPSAEIVSDIENLVCSYDGVIGIHDLIVHSYGTSRVFASVHAEVPANCDIMETHDIIDCIEREANEKFGIELSIHMDPIDIDNPKIAEYRDFIEKSVKNIDSELTIHDLRIVSGTTHTNIIFDVVTPQKFRLSDDEIKQIIDNDLAQKYHNLFTVITFDKSYI